MVVHLLFYPNGHLGQRNDLISLSLELAHNKHTGQPEPDHVNLVARLTLVPHHGKQPPA